MNRAIVKRKEKDNENVVFIPPQDEETKALGEDRYILSGFIKIRQSPQLKSWGCWPQKLCITGSYKYKIKH